MNNGYYKYNYVSTTFLDLMQSFLYDLITCFLVEEERSAKYLA